MMTTEEAMSYLQESKKTATGTAETETAQTTTETELQPGADGGNGGEGGSPNPAEDGAGTGEDGGNGEGGTPTDQADGKASTPQGGKPDGAGNDTDILEKNKARWAESFRKEKDKRKRQRIQYENKIASLNKQIAELKTKLDGGLDRKSDEGMQTLIDMNVAQRELKRVEDERTQAQIEEDQEENERRVVACFPDEADRNVYRTLVKNSGEAFAQKLYAEDPDNVILDGLDDCDISPIVVRVLMTKPKFLDEILSKKGRHAKERAFDNLVDSIRHADRLIKSKNAAGKQAPKQTGVEAPKKGLGNIKPTGKQAKAGSADDAPVVKDSAYWNNYLKAHGAY